MNSNDLVYFIIITVTKCYVRLWA